MLTTLRRLFGKTNSRNIRKPRPQAFGRLEVEALEDRCLLSAAAQVIGSTLIVSTPPADLSNHFVQLQKDKLQADQTDVLDAGQLIGSFDNASFTQININLGGGTDIVNLTNVRIPLFGISIDGGAGNNGLIGPLSATTWTLQGPNTGTLPGVTFQNVQNLCSGSGHDTFAFAPGSGLSGAVYGAGASTLDYSAYNTAVAVNLAAGTATGMGAGIGAILNVTGSLFNDVLVGNNANNTLRGFGGRDVMVGYGGGNHTFVLDSNQSGSAVYGGSGTDTLVEKNADNTWGMTAPNTGIVNGVGFTGIASLVGGTGTDNFYFATGGMISGSLNGGGGDNWLNYTYFTAPVYANLTTAAATCVGGGTAGLVANVQNIVGSNFNNYLVGKTTPGTHVGSILVGGNSIDVLVGGNGRNILVGGNGNDIIVGGTDQDLVIGGSVNFGANRQAALTAVLREWQRTDVSYGERIDDLREGTGLNGSYRLAWGSTVLDDAGSNSLYGEPTGSTNALDWFFANPNAGHDQLWDARYGEIVD